MSDNQPWIAAYDFTRLLSLHRPQTLHRIPKPVETRRVPVRYYNGNEEVIQEWPTREVIPTQHDQHAPDSELPRRVMLSWQCQGLMLLEWQSELWMPWEQVPRYVDS